MRIRVHFLSPQQLVWQSIICVQLGTNERSIPANGFPNRFWIQVPVKTPWSKLRWQILSMAFLVLLERSLRLRERYSYCARYSTTNMRKLPKLWENLNPIAVRYSREQSATSLSESLGSNRQKTRESR